MPNRDRLSAGAAVVAVVLAVVAVWQFVAAPRHWSDDEFVAATTERVELLIAADRDDPERAGRILSGATGSFADAFAQSADAYTEYVARADTRGDGHVDGVALARRDGESAVMLVAASLMVSTAQGRDSAPTLLRMRVLMTPEDRQLKIAALEVLG